MKTTKHHYILLQTEVISWNIQRKKDYRIKTLEFLSGHEKAAELLIQNGADVNAKDVSYDTPLHLAVKEGDFMGSLQLLWPNILLSN